MLYIPEDHTKIDQTLRNTNKNYEWYTPDNYLTAIRRVLGTIDLDPASCFLAQLKVQAKSILTKEDNALNFSWFGHVFCNPPYSYPLVEQFSNKLISEYESGNVTEAILLVNNATDTNWFYNITKYPVMFSRGRAKFWKKNGIKFATRQGQAIFYFGSDKEKFFNAFADIAYAPNRA